MKLPLIRFAQDLQGGNRKIYFVLDIQGSYFEAGFLNSPIGHLQKIPFEMEV